VISFIGNYFWTHYFYVVLGASYHMPSLRLNNVPVPLFLITQAYFTMYHTLSNIFLRTYAGNNLVAQIFIITSLSYALAFMETWTLENYPDYAIKDRQAMYTLGSAFYSIYFLVSFPAFFRLDEDAVEAGQSKKPLWWYAWDCLAACMLVTCLLDFVKLAFGPIYTHDASSAHNNNVVFV
jgi:cycloeucalenol cycloisomerase